MRHFRIFLTIILLSMSFICKGQEDIYSQIKHVELVSEVSDTMALINKTDVNKINKVFYERNYLDSLRVVDSCLLETTQEINKRLDSIVVTQINTIANQGLVIKKYKDLVAENNEEMLNFEEQHKKDKNSKIAWQSVSGTLAAVLLVVLLL